MSETGAIPKPKSLLPSGSKRAGEVVAAIEADIMARGWPVGEVIGTVSELVDRYGVSRAVMREAVGLLEHKMIVQMRPGPGGGVEVRAPVAEAVVGAITTYLDFLDVKPGELAELRHVMMGFAARLATERIDESGIVRLRGLLEAERKAAADGAQAVEHQLDFYATVAELAENPALSLFWSVLIQRLVKPLLSSPPDAAEFARSQEDHAAVVRAIVSGDASGAEARMREHLSRRHDAVVTAIETCAVALDPTRFDADALDALGLPLVIDRNGEREKLPARVARELKDLILAGGFETGHVIGMEGELIDRFGVSRSAFREAVRIIEFYGLAEMRRGPRGGLTVTEPDAAVMEEAVISYLEFMGIGLDHLLEIRITLELMNVEWAIERGRAELDGLIEVVEDEPVGMLPVRRFEVHDLLSRLSGNRASVLFTGVLSKLIDRHVLPNAPLPELSEEERAALETRGRTEHARIVEAVVAGDVELARHRMLRHLEFIAIEFDRLARWHRGRR